MGGHSCREKLALDQQLLQSTLMETSGELAFLQRRPSGSSMGPDALASEVGASSDEGPRTPSPHHRAVLHPWGEPLDTTVTDWPARTAFYQSATIEKERLT